LFYLFSLFIAADSAVLQAGGKAPPSLLLFVLFEWFFHKSSLIYLISESSTLKTKMESGKMVFKF